MARTSRSPMKAKVRRSSLCTLEAARRRPGRWLLGGLHSTIEFFALIDDRTGSRVMLS